MSILKQHFLINNNKFIMHPYTDDRMQKNPNIKFKLYPPIIKDGIGDMQLSRISPIPSSISLIKNNLLGFPIWWHSIIFVRQIIW